MANTNVRFVVLMVSIKQFTVFSSKSDAESADLAILVWIGDNDEWTKPQTCESVPSQDNRTC